MLFMNTYEIERVADLFSDPVETPNLYHAANVLLALASWADRTSDGWHSWPKPCRAAKQLQELLQSKERDFRDHGCVSRAGESGVVHFTDATDAEVKKVLAPIKSLLTREKVPGSTAVWILTAGLPQPPAEPAYEWDPAILDDVVHDVASEIASNVINNSEHTDWLHSQGWTDQDIEEAVSERQKEQA